MISNLTAQPRPPPPIRNASSGWTMQRSFASLPPSRRASISTLHTSDVAGDTQMAFESDLRPSKKRKIESRSHASSPILLSSPMEGVETTSIKDERTQQGSYKAAIWQATAYGQSHAYLQPGIRTVRAAPLPQTPWTDGNFSEPLPGRIRTPCRYRADVVVPNTPDTLHSPPDAPLLESKKRADYFPWVGNHNEDTITPDAVKNGYWDKPPPLEKESNTARGPLYNAFKHRSGLESLSSLFALVLEKRSKHDALSSTTTFKPPPRVTLTEAKRRSWIADLADASVPLKRLSRTIPQGIRGLALLEQCAVNVVPLNRALWFVKCVGANEIRTLKRKGVNANITAGAEVKWLREWTTNIEQFMEAAIDHSDMEKWAEALTYCLQLCTRMYQENLMDRDHFLDWLARNLGSCSTELFAAWMPVYQLFKKDLVKFRKRGRQVVGIFLARLKQFADWPSTQNYLKPKLQTAIHSLIHFKPACFLMPDKWEQYRNILRDCLRPADDEDERLYEYIEKRNERMLRTEDSTGDVKSADRSVFDILDNSSAATNINTISGELLRCRSDFIKLCDLCLQWATSRFRGGTRRIYLVARLLRRWQRAGHDIDTPLLAYFSHEHDPDTLNLDDYRHLFAELSRTNTFSRSRFLQTLSIQSVSERNENTKQHDCAFLLRDLCLNEGEEHMNHLKRYLLNRHGQESGETDTSSFFIRRLREVLTSTEEDIPELYLTNAENAQLSDMDWSSKFEVCRWLRDQAIALSKAAEFEVPGMPALPGSRLLTLNQFVIIRNALETVGDVSVLADVLRILSNTKQEHILASMVDALHFHARTLSAIGAFEALQRLYSQAYITLRASRPSMLLFGTSLLDLCLHYPCPVAPARALQYDLVKGDRARALSACSPFSDGVAESLQQAGETFLDDFEAILQGEPNMGEQTMTSLFTVLIGRIMKSDVVSTSQNTFLLCQLLSRLRLNRTVQADMLIKRWLTKLFTAAWSNLHTNIILELLNTRCISLMPLLDLSNSAPPAAKCREAISNLILDGLLQETEATGGAQNYYVVRLAAQRLVSEDPFCVLELMLSKCEVDERSVGLYATLLSNVLRDSTKLSALSANATGNLSRVVYQMLQLEPTTAIISQQFLSRMNWLSLPFCRSAIATQEKVTSPSSGAAVAEEADVIFRSLGLHSEAGGMDLELSQALIQSMPDNIQDHVRTLVERQFYDSMPKFFQAKAISQPLHITLEERAQSLKAADKLVSLGPARNGSVPGDSNGLMIEKLTIIAKALGARSDGLTVGGNQIQNVPSPGSPAPFQNTITSSQLADGRYRDTALSVLEYLYMLLKILSMKASLFTSSTNGSALPKTTQNEQIKLIFCLLTIATQPNLAGLLQANVEGIMKERIRECIEFTLDVAARLVDDLSDEARIMCAKIMKDRLKDERVAWLVGSMASCASSERGSDSGLIVMHEMKGYVGEFRPKRWELLESGGGKENDGCLGLGLFGAKKV